MDAPVKRKRRMWRPTAVVGIVACLTLVTACSMLADLYLIRATSTIHSQLKSKFAERDIQDREHREHLEEQIELLWQEVRPDGER